MTEIIDNAPPFATASRSAAEPGPGNQGFAEHAAVGRAIDLLRLETHAVHGELDASLHLIDRLSASRLRVGVLSGYHRLHHQTEAAVAPFLAAVPDLDFSARRRSPLIAADMAALGVKTLPDHLTGFAVRTAGQAFGAFYVLEGSSLGGRVILKELKRRGVPLAGLGFLDPYGGNTGPRWRSFLAILEREIRSREKQHEAVSGALNAFAFARSCLCRESDH